MSIIIAIFVIFLLTFVLFILYNAWLISREELVRQSFIKKGNDRYNYSEAADDLLDIIKEFSNQAVYVFAGEFNYELYNTLFNRGLPEVLKNNNIKLVAIGGPFISVPDDEGGGNKIIEMAKDGILELYLRKDNKRTIGHGFVAEKSNSLCLLEDPHEEFDERSLTVFRNSLYFCNVLRRKVNALMSEAVSFKVADFSPEKIKEYVKAKSSIVKENEGMRIEEDERLAGRQLIEPEENPLPERRRLNWLAQIV